MGAHREQQATPLLLLPQAVASRRHPENITSLWKFSFHRYDEHGLVYRPDAPAEVFKKIENLVAGMRSDDRDLKKTGTAIHSSRSDLCRWIHAEGGDKHLRPLNANERDLALGFPAGASRLPTSHPRDKLGEEFGRCLLSGNAWSHPAAAHILRHLSLHTFKNQATLETNLAVPGFTSIGATLAFLQPEDRSSAPKGGEGPPVTSTSSVADRRSRQGPLPLRAAPG